MGQSIGVIGLKYFFVDFLGGIAFFPVWWYTRGLVKTARGLRSAFRSYGQTLSVRVWVKNLFVPMYGTKDIQGRIISVFMRLVNIVARSFLLFMAGLLYSILFLAYLVLPLFVVYQILFNLLGGL